MKRLLCPTTNTGRLDWDWDWDFGVFNTDLPPTVRPADPAILAPVCVPSQWQILLLASPEPAHVEGQVSSWGNICIGHKCQHPGRQEGTLHGTAMCACRFLSKPICNQLQLWPPISSCLAVWLPGSRILIFGLSQNH